MRAARKKNGITQMNVARKIGVSQSALSKMESGYLIPSAPQWFDFCGITQIAPESLTTGFIERTQGESSDTAFRLPKSYREHRGSKARAVQPFLRFAREALGEEKADELIESLQVDPDYFTDLDHQISMTFSLDLVRKLISAGSLKVDALDRLVGPVSEPAFHGSLGRKYLAEASWIERFKLLLGNAPLYESNFKYRVEEQNEKGLAFSIAPEAHLASIKYKDDALLGDFLCKFKQRYFTEFTRFGASAAATLTERECHFHGAERCVYEMRGA